MRTIDADALKERIRRFLCVKTLDYLLPSEKAIVEQIDHMPTIDQERKGKWKETDDGWDGTYYVCSECGCPWTLIDGTPLDNGMNYCPNCGCKMEVEE